MTNEDKLEERRAYQRKYRQEHPEKARAWREEHREKYREYQRKYRQEHLEELKAYYKDYYERVKNTPEYRTTKGLGPAGGTPEYKSMMEERKRLREIKKQEESASKRKPGRPPVEHTPEELEERRQRTLETSRKYYAAHLDYYRSYSRAYYKTHKEQYKAYKKTYREKQQQQNTPAAPETTQED